MQKQTMPTPEQLAREFAALLADQCLNYNTGEHKLDEAVRRNDAETDPSICHTHDFCDSNQTMLDAMERFGMELDLQDESQVNLITEAWSIAKSNRFWIQPELK